MTLKRDVTPRKIPEKKGPSQGDIQKCEPQERSPWAPKFEDRTQEGTLQKERCVRREDWDLAKNVNMLNAKDKATFFSPSEVWSLPAPSSKKPEERDSSMHMNRSESTRTGNPSKIQEPHEGYHSQWREVQTNEEATENVHDLELFVTVQILEDTLAVLS